MSSEIEMLVYDRKARDEFFANYDKLIQWSKDYGFLKAAMDHAQNKKRLIEYVSMLD